MSEWENVLAPVDGAPDTSARRPGLPDEDRISLPASAPAKRLTPPDVRLPVPSGLIRPRLVATFDRVLDVRLCAVVAPPGSGKTTALAHWARQAAVDVLWWRADPGTTEPVADVLAGIAATLRPRGPRLPTVPDIADLVDALDGQRGPVVVVLDDFHHVATDRVGALLERLLLATSSQVHVMIGSRVLPPLNLARSELASHVVGPSDLRFRPIEVAALFRVEYRIPLGAEDARVLARQTEGWAAALHLFHHGVAGHGPHARHRALAGLGDGAGYARDYLTRTFLADLDTADLAFLRNTAPFEALVGGYCDRLLGRTGSDGTIARLARRGVVTPLEDGRGFALPRVLRHYLLSGTTTDVGPQSTGRAFRAAAEILDGRDRVGGSLDGARGGACLGRRRGLAGGADGAGRVLARGPGRSRPRAGSTPRRRTSSPTRWSAPPAPSAPAVTVGWRRPSTCSGPDRRPARRCRRPVQRRSRASAGPGPPGTSSRRAAGRNTSAPPYGDRTPTGGPLSLARTRRS